ncbi:MAG: tetratricopeptide repeat protein, partial [Bacteroidales bacterium]
LLSVLTASPPVGAQAARQQPVVNARPGESYYVFLEARRHETDGDIEEAIKLYKQAAALDPQSGQILAALASLYARQNRAREAITAAEQALKLKPDTTEAHFVLGSIYAVGAESAEAEGGTTGKSAAAEFTSRAIPHLEAVQKARGATTDPGVMLMLGRLYLRVHANDKAVAVLTRFNEQDPEAIEGISLLAQAYTQTGNSAEAERLLNQAAAREPSFYAILAEMYERTGRWEKAAEAYKTATQAGADSAEVKERWALALLNSGRPDAPAKARDVLQQVLSAEANNLRALYLLAQAQRELHDRAAAEATARRLMAADPQGASGPFALAQLFEDEHDPRRVVDTLQPVVDRLAGARRSGVDLTPLLLHLAYAYIDLGQADRAMSVLDRARQGEPDNPAIASATVQAHVAAKRYQPAIDTAVAARKQFPDDMPLARAQADAFAAAGQIERAIGVLQDAARARPDDVGTVVALAELLSGAGRAAEAITLLQQAGTRFPDDDSVLFQLGAVYERQKKWSEAEDAFRKVIARDPGHAEALNYLGFMLADRGVRLAESIEYIKRALDLDPNNPSYLDSLGWAYFKMNRLDLAEKNLREAAARRANDSEIQDHWGDLLWKAGRRDEAVGAWQRALDGDGESIDRAAIETKIRSARAKSAKKHD